MNELEIFDNITANAIIECLFSENRNYTIDEISYFVCHPSYYNNITLDDISEQLCILTQNKIIYKTEDKYSIDYTHSLMFLMRVLRYDYS